MVIEFNGKSPKIADSAFITEDAMIIGDVEIGQNANIWFGSIVRGDLNYIRIGKNCNIQDGCLIHVVKDLYPVILEDDVALGHRVVIHGCRVGRGSLIGIGAIVLDGSVIGEESIVGAGAVVAPKSIIPPRSIVMGTPAKVVRTLNDDDIVKIKGIIQEYLELKEIYRNLGK